MRSRRKVTLLLSVLFIVPAFGLAARLALSRSFTAPVLQEKSDEKTISQTDPSAPVADLITARSGRFLTVAVQLQSGQTVSFLIDTGAAITIFDSSLRNDTDPIVGQSTVATSAGNEVTALYPCPQAAIGPLTFRRLQAIAYADLRPIRQASALDIQGILGVDFLGQYAVELDFDGGHVRLWERSPKHWSSSPVQLPLVNCDGRTGVEILVAGVHREVFIIDTGANVSTLREDVFDLLAREELLKVVGSRTAVTARGSVRGSSGFVRNVEVGRHELQQIRMDRDRYSAIGVRHLSRFLVRLDFPNKVCSLQPGEEFPLPDANSTAGMGIVLVDGRKVVSLVERYGPAAKAGIRIDDIIELINGKEATSFDLFDLSQLMTRSPDVPIELELSRESQRYSTTLFPRSLQLNP